MSIDQERRDFFRIEDEVTMQLTPQSAPLGDDTSPVDQLDSSLPEEFIILNQLRKLDNDSVQLMRSIQDKHRDIAQYFKTQNDKFELLSRYIANQLKDNFKLHQVNISGSGLKFHDSKEYPVNSNWHLKLLLYPDCYGFYCQTKVIQCEPKNKGFDVTLEFTNINTHDQDELVKHITRLQSQKLRKERLGH